MDNQREQQVINQLLALSRSNRKKTFLLMSIALSSVAGGFILFFPLNVVYKIVLMVLVLIVSYWLQLSSRAYTNINQDAMLEHINCTFPDFEQSSQLILEQQPNSILQQLQKQKIEALFTQQNIDKIKHSLTPVQYQTALKILIVSMMLFIVQKTSVVMPLTFEPKISLSNRIEIPDVKVLAPRLVSNNIKIMPPKYTGIKRTHTSELNLNILEGTKIQWQLEFSRKDLNYFIVDTQGNRTALNKQENSLLEISQKFTQTSLYSFAYRENGKFYSMQNVYTIEVALDEFPKIKIIHPKQSLVEIPKLGKASFDLVAEITDDYGLSKTTILASVASGSGEAVKFRDAVFLFDETSPIKSGRLFKKHWNLKDLKMEPGDEVYFKIITEDNKQPIPQQKKSSSIIVRWLDNEIRELAADGIQIHFIPEYFRSQRQIIIETEQLIQDRSDLTLEQLAKLSTSLGHSQNDLKIKYGQYLGDEVGGGPGEQLGGVEAVEEHTGTESDEHDEEQHQEPEVGHLHDEMIDETDRSGASALIARFAHNHGTTEIGPISKQDPKSWMKMAVKEMWQAELHLMLSEPEKALDFEYKAYDYLKLATAAERVYLKRLGFEPPPVNEDTRLKGELKDILNYSKQVEDKPDQKSDVILYQAVYQILSQHETTPLTTNDKGLLKQLKQRLLVLSKTRPSLIKHAATVEKMLTRNAIAIKKCTLCISRLKQKLWQLMPEANSLPNILNSQLETELDSLYLTKILQLKNTQSSNSVDGDDND